MDAIRRQVATSSEIDSFWLFWKAVAGGSAFELFAEPQLPQGVQSGPGDTCSRSGLCYWRETQSLGSLNFS